MKELIQAWREYREMMDFALDEELVVLRVMDKFMNYLAEKEEKKIDRGFYLPREQEKPDTKTRELTKNRIKDTLKFWNKEQEKPECEHEYGITSGKFATSTTRRCIKCGNDRFEPTPQDQEKPETEWEARERCGEKPFDKPQDIPKSEMPTCSKCGRTIGYGEHVCY